MSVSGYQTTGELPSVFLCHSKKQRELATKLRNALLARQVPEVWFDEKDVVYAEHWQNAILPAIADMDVFLYLASSDSEHSTACQAEVARAAELNKRTVVVEYSPSHLEGRLGIAVRAPLSEAPDTDTLNPEEIEKILSLITVDGEEARWHRKIQSQTLEWNTLGVIGLRLREAISTRDHLRLMAKRNVPPLPTGPMFRYVEACIQAGVRRLLMWIIGILIVVGLVAWLISSWLQSTQAERVSKGEAIANASTRALNRQPDIAAMLAVSAWRTGVHTPGVLSALHQSLAIPIDRYLRPTAKLFNDSSMVQGLTSWSSGLAVITRESIDLTDWGGSPKVSIKLPSMPIDHVWLANPDDSDRGPVLWTGGEQICTGLIDLKAASIKAERCAPSAPIPIVARGSKGALAWVNEKGTQVHVLEIGQNDILQSVLKIPDCAAGSEIRSLVYHPTIGAFILGVVDGTLAALSKDQVGGGCLVKLPGYAEVMAASPTDDTLAIRLRENSLSTVVLVTNIRSEPQLKRSRLTEIDIAGGLPLSFDAQGKIIYAGDLTGRLKRIGTDGHGLGTALPAHGIMLTAMYLDSTGHLITGGGDGSVIRWRSNESNGRRGKSLAQEVKYFDLSSRDEIALVISGELQIRNVDNKIRCSASGLSELKGVTWSADAALLFSWTDSTLYRISTHNCAVVDARRYNGIRQVIRVGMNGYGLLLDSKSGGRFVYNGRNEEGVDWIGATPTGAAVVFKRGENVFFGSGDSQVLKTNASLGALSPSGEHWAYPGNGTDLHILNRNTGLTTICDNRPVGTADLLENWASSNEVHYAAKASRIAMALGSGGVLVCDAESGKPIMVHEFDAGFGWVKIVRLSTSGEQLFVVVDSELRLIDLSGEITAQELCKLSGARTVPETEWLDFVDAIDFRDTCPMVTVKLDQ